MLVFYSSWKPSCFSCLPLLQYKNIHKHKPCICLLWTFRRKKNSFYLTEPKIKFLPPSVSFRPNRPEQEDYRVSNDWRDQPRQFRLWHSGRGRHARGVWLGNVLQTNSHSSRAAEGRPQWTLWVSDNTLYLDWIIPSTNLYCCIKFTKHCTVDRLCFRVEKIIFHAVAFNVRFHLRGFSDLSS